MKDIIFEENIIRFKEYPFFPASVFPNGSIAAKDIKEILLSFAPPEIRTIKGEVIFISALYKDDLKKFANKNNILIVERIDVWDLILDEFLDTEFDKEWKEKSLIELQKNGISRDEVAKIREKLSGAMISYNFETGLWEWVHLGLYDALNALSTGIINSRYKLNNTEFERFYFEAMEIACKARLR